MDSIIGFGGDKGSLSKDSTTSDKCAEASAQTVVGSVNKLMLIPPSLALLLLFGAMFAPIYPVTAAETLYSCHALGGCETLSTGESAMYNSTIDVVSNNFKWESKSQRMYTGLDYHRTITTYEADPWVLGFLLLVPLFGFLLAYAVVRRVGRRGDGSDVE